MSMGSPAPFDILAGILKSKYMIQFKATHVASKLFALSDNVSRVATSVEIITIDLTKTFSE